MKEEKFNFVINATEAELKTYLHADSIDTAFIAARGDLSWCFEAYRAISKRANLDCLLSNGLRTDAINIVHAGQLLELKGNVDHFIVCVQGDLPRRHWAHYHLVQNKNQLAANTAFIPHWIQPNIIARNTDRSKVTQVAYVGPINMAGVPPEEDWQSFLKPYAIGFRLFSGPWNDLSGVDVLIGIRSFDANPHDTKPPSRLFSAWHAQVAFIGGQDSAYQQVGTPGEDYLVVQTPYEVVDAILRLRNDDGLFKKLVTNGKMKTEQYNNVAIAQDWEALLAGPVLKRYLQWKGRPYYEQQRFRSLLHLSLL